MCRSICGLLLVNFCLLAQHEEAAFVRQAEARLTQPGLSSPERLKLQSQRDDALFVLMKSAPKDAWNFLQKQAPTHFEGMASALVEDDFETHTSIHKWRLTGDSVREVFFASDAPALSCESNAAVEGYELRGRIVATSAQVKTGAISACLTTGVQKVAVIMVQFPSQALPAAITKPMLTSALFGATRSIDAFWREASYGKTSATGDVFGPITLAADYTCDQADAILTATLTAASATVNLTAYNRIVMVIPQRGSCSIGLGQVGCGTFGSPQGLLSISPVWLRADYLTDSEHVLASVSHEGGHNLGLDHSNRLSFGSIPLGMFKGGTTVEYEDFFSIMGALWGQTPFGFLVPHYSAPHKSFLGWFSTSNLQQVESNGTFTLLPYELAQAGLQALKIRRGAGNDAWVWVEYRQPIGFDSGLSSYSANVFPGAALVHYYDSGHDSLHTQLISFDAAVSTDFSLAPLQVGSSWSDPYSLLNLRANSASTAGLSVTVSYDAACAALSSSTVSAGSAGSTGSIAVTAPNTCAWTATSSDTWLSVTGGASGTGNGTVSYSIAANGAGAQSRNAFLVIQRQTVAVTQSVIVNVAPTVNFVTPSSFTGASGTVTINYSDANGASDIRLVQARFANSGGSCTISGDPTNQNLSLLADDGTTILGPVALSSTATVENSFCRVHANGSSISLGVTAVAFAVTLDFKAISGGTAIISGAATDAAGAGGSFQSLGSATIPCSYVLGGSAASAQGAGGAASLTLTTGTACAWTAASSTPAWLTVTSAGSGAGSTTVNYATAANTGAARAGTLTVGGQTFTVNQSASLGVAPNYASYVEHLDCTGLSGWAADRNRPNQSINVNVYDGSTLLGTVTANQSRGDVGAFLGDNGLHGFSFTLPSTVRDGGAHTFHVTYESTATELVGSAKTFTCSAGASYAGWVDGASCSGVSGWAADKSRPGQTIAVSLWYNGAVIATTTANGSRPDVGSVTGDSGLHGFSLSLPAAYLDGVGRTYSMRYESSTTNLPAGDAITLSCSGTALYSGWLDATSCSAISGWAADRSRANQSISVDLVEGSTVLTTILANLSRPDVGQVVGDNGAHGFSFPTPAALKSGTTRTINLRYSGTSQSLGNSPKTLACAAGAAAYTGWVDSVSCSGISGWAADRNSPNASIAVEFYDGATLVGISTANGSRSDVGAVLGDNGLHGFSLTTPLSLKDGRAHTITVRPAGSTFALTGASGLTCP